MKKHLPAQLWFILAALFLLVAWAKFTLISSPIPALAATPTPDIPAIVDQLYLGLSAGNGHQPQRLALDSPRRRLYTFNTGLPQQGHTLSVVDLPTGQVMALIPLDNTIVPAQPTDLFPSTSFPARPLALQVDPYRPRLYALWGDLYADPPYSNLTIIDTETLTPLTTLPGVWGIAPGPDRLYLVNDTRLWSLYPDTLAQLTEIQLQALTTNLQPPISNLQSLISNTLAGTRLQSPIALNPATNRLYLAANANALLALNAETLALLGSYTAPAQLLQFAVDPAAERVLVIDHDNTQVYLRALDADARPPAEPAPFILTDDTYLSPHLALVGPIIYLTNRTIDSDLLQIFDANLNLTGSRPIPGYPADMAADPATGLAYLPYTSPASYLLGLNPATDARQVIYTALSLVEALADPAANRLYALTNDGALHVLNLKTYAEIARLETPVFNPQKPTYSSAPFLSLDPGRNRLYLGGDSPQVVDTTALTLTAALDTPGQLTADPASNRLFLTPPCQCRTEQCNTLILNTDTLTGAAALFPPQDPFVAPCVMATHLDAPNRLLYTRINNGVPGSNSGSYFTVFDVTGPPQQIYTNGDISFGSPAFDPPRARAFISRYRMDRSSLNRFELQGQTITPTWQLVGTGGQLVFDPAAERLYEVNGPVLQVFDGDLALLSQTTLPGEFTPFTFDSTGQRLYLGNTNADMLVLAASGGQLDPPQPANPAPSTDWPQLFIAPDGARFRLFNRQLYRSTDAGQNWQLLGQGLPQSQAIALAISPNYAADRTLLAGLSTYTNGGGLYRSTDGGDTWRPTTRGLTDLAVTHLTFSPSYTRDQTIFLAAESGGLYRSTNEGDTWQVLTPNYTADPAGNHVTSLAASPQMAGLVVISAGSLRRSADGGDTWQDTGLPPGLVAFGPDGLLLSDGRWRSQDGGQSWQPSAAGLAPNQGGRSLFFSPTYAADQTVYLLLYQNYDQPLILQRSVDAGRTWESLLSGLPANFNLAAATVLPNGYLYLSDQNGQLLEISPQALTWGRRPVDITGLEWPALTALAPETVWAANSQAGVIESQDGGRAWAETDFPGRADESRPARLALAADGALLAATGAVLGRSSDGGQSWDNLPLPAGFEVYALAVSPNFSHDGVILAGGDYAANQLLRSADGGQSWQLVFDGKTIAGAAEFGALAVSPNFAVDGTAYAWLQYGGLLRSTDGGQTWLRVASDYDNAVAQVLAVSPDNRLYLGTLYGGLYVSADGGQSWQDLGKNIPDQRTWSSALAFGPANSLLLGTDIGLYRSLDGGQSWSAASQGLPLDPDRNVPVGVRALAFDGRRFYAGLTQGGLYVSDDGGQSWRVP